MAKLRLKTAFQYCFKDSLRGLLIFIGIMLLVHIALTSAIVIFAQPGNSVGTISIYGVAATIALFVTGIVTVREHLRLLIQHGIGRRTAFISGIGVAVSLALAAALAELLINWLSLAIIHGSTQITYTSFYQMTFNGGQQVTAFTDIIGSAAISLVMYLTAYLMGMLVSLVFYRLPKPWKIVVAVGVPVFFVIILPLLAASQTAISFLTPIGIALMRLGEFTFSSAGNYMLVSVAWALIIAGCCLLLTRRAPIR
jgi:hypothetical protein